MCVCMYVYQIEFYILRHESTKTKVHYAHTRGQIGWPAAQFHMPLCCSMLGPCQHSREGKEEGEWEIGIEREGGPLKGRGGCKGPEEVLCLLGH